MANISIIYVNNDYLVYDDKLKTWAFNNMPSLYIEWTVSHET